MASPCIACGRCCTAEVPVTLAEIARLAAFLGEPAGDFFRRALKPALSPTFGLPLLGKRPDGICLLENEAGRCTVHPVKPRLCRAFVCLEHPDGAPGDEETLDLIAWLCESPEAETTRAYVGRHGLAWDGEAFLAATGGEPAAGNDGKL